MDRKEFLTTVCGLGACGCALGLLGVTGRSEASDPPADDQRLLFARYQLAKLVGFLTAGATAEAGAAVLAQTGRECAKLGRLGPKFEGDPEGYFAAARQNWGTEFAWDKERGVVTVAVAEGPCGCPLVDARRMPAAWCNCSVGYQQEIFESVFGRPVTATLKESKLAGATRCVFEVTLA